MAIEVIRFEPLSGAELESLAAQLAGLTETPGPSALDQSLPIADDDLRNGSAVELRLDVNEAAPTKDSRGGMFSGFSRAVNKLRTFRQKSPERMTPRSTTGWRFVGKIALTIGLSAGVGLNAGAMLDNMQPQSRQPVPSAAAASPDRHTTTTLPAEEKNQRWFDGLNTEQQTNFHRMVGFITNLEQNWGFTEQEAVDRFETAATFAYNLQAANSNAAQP